MLDEAARAFAAILHSLRGGASLSRVYSGSGCLPERYLIGDGALLAASAGHATSRHLTGTSQFEVYVPGLPFSRAVAYAVGAGNGSE